MHILTALKMFYVKCKCVFYSPALNAKGEGPMELNFEDLEMKHTNG